MSDFGKLNWADLGKSMLIAFLTPVIGALYSALNAATTGGTMPDLHSFGAWCLAGGAAALAYLLKNVFTNSANQLLTTEKKA